MKQITEANSEQFEDAEVIAARELVGSDEQADADAKLYKLESETFGVRVEQDGTEDITVKMDANPGNAVNGFSKMCENLAEKNGQTCEWAPVA